MLQCHSNPPIVSRRFFWAHAMTAFLVLVLFCAPARMPYYRISLRLWRPYLFASWANSIPRTTSASVSGEQCAGVTIQGLACSPPMLREPAGLHAPEETVE